MQFIHKFLPALYTTTIRLNQHVTVFYKFMNAIYSQISSCTIYNNYTIKSTSDCLYKFMNAIYSQISSCTIYNNYTMKSISDCLLQIYECNLFTNFFPHYIQQLYD